LALKTKMGLFPECTFLKARSGEFSPIDNLNCVGPFYADQIEMVCGSRLIGPVVQFFSKRDFESVKVDLIRCSRNKRAGEKLIGDKLVPLFNSRVMMSLLQLLALGRKHPNCFTYYPVNIAIPSAILNEYLIHVQTQS
jgi:hypothetical protein